MSLYYYLRVVITMYRVDPAPFEARLATSMEAGRRDRLAVSAVALLSVLTVALGVYPTPLLRLIEQVTAALR